MVKTSHLPGHRIGVWIVLGFGLFRDSPYEKRIFPTTPKVLHLQRRKKLKPPVEKVGQKPPVVSRVKMAPVKWPKIPWVLPGPKHPITDSENGIGTPQKNAEQVMKDTSYMIL